MYEKYEKELLNLEQFSDDDEDVLAVAGVNKKDDGSKPPEKPKKKPKKPKKSKVNN